MEHYPVYYLTGYILFTMFTSSTSGAISSIINSAMLIKKMYIPNYLFPVEKCLFEFINTSVVKKEPKAKAAHIKFAFSEGI